jgi:hypothetical protein
MRGPEAVRREMVLQAGGQASFHARFSSPRSGTARSPPSSSGPGWGKLPAGNVSGPPLTLPLAGRTLWQIATGSGLPHGMKLLVIPAGRGDGMGLQKSQVMRRVWLGWARLEAPHRG